MTDEQIIQILANKMGIRILSEAAPDFPPWLSSKDALAPVLEILTAAERAAVMVHLMPPAPGWQHFWEIFPLLTIPPRQLAEAIAEAIKDENKGTA